MIKSEEAKERRRIRDKEYKRKWRIDHLDILKIRAKVNYEKHKEEWVIYRRQNYLKNRERLIAKQKEYYINNKEKVKAYQVRKRIQDKDTRRWCQIKKNYGISMEEFNNLFISQGNVCGVCGGNNFYKQGPNVDHDHDTNRVRGILCNQCNVGLGSFKDSIVLLQKAIEYLNKYNVAL